MKLLELSILLDIEDLLQKLNWTWNCCKIVNVVNIPDCTKTLDCCKSLKLMVVNIPDYTKTLNIMVVKVFGFTVLDDASHFCNTSSSSRLQMLKLMN